MAIVKIKSLTSIENYCAYMISKSKHKGQEIITVNNFQENVNAMFNDMETYKQGRRGHKPKPLSYMLSYPKGTSTKELLNRYKNTMTDFYHFMSQEENLGLSEEDIQQQIKKLVTVIHSKPSNPHIHVLVPRVIKNSSTNEFSYVDTSKRKYLNRMKRFNGWSIEEKIQNKKVPSLHDFREEKRNEEVEELKEEVKQFKAIGGKLYKLCLIDLEKGHTDKAIKKLSKLKKYQNKMEQKL